MKNILLIGPLPRPITGQSIAFELVVNELNKSEYKAKVLNYTKFTNTIMYLIHNIFILIEGCFVLIFNKHIKLLYLTTSRSKLGFLRDMFFISVAWVNKVKVVNHLHGSDFIKFRNSQPPFLVKLINSAYRKIDCSIVLTPKMKEQYADYPDMKVEVLSNFCPPEVYAFRFDEKNESLKILFLSNLMYSKGVIHLIKACIKLSELGVKFELNVAGKAIGDEYKSADEIQQIFNIYLKKYNWLNYHGIVSGREKILLLNNNNVFCLPTFYKTEAQPISIIEGICSGSTILSTNFKYISELVSNQSGLLVKPESVDALVDALFTLSNSEQRINYSSNNLIMKNDYSPDLHIKKLLDIFKGIL
jgi:glycosyltransferase involved in cell wall biosynthesis